MEHTGGMGGVTAWKRVCRYAVMPLCLVVAASLSACSRESWNRFPSPDDLVGMIPWFSNMHRGPAPQPYSINRPPVPGTVPVGGKEIELDVNFDEQLPRINRLENPVPRTAESLDRGKEVYNIYCYPCHGPAGAGDGPVTPMFIQPPDLTAPRARDFTDGYLYTLIRQGRGIMPMYGDKIRVQDRWHLVNYLRLLQESPTQ
jgi:mono/diheme cytochrome c family protein